MRLRRSLKASSTSCMYRCANFVPTKAMHPTECDPPCKSMKRGPRMAGPETGTEFLSVLFAAMPDGDKCKDEQR